MSVKIDRLSNTVLETLSKIIFEEVKYYVTIFKIR